MGGILGKYLSQMLLKRTVATVLILTGLLQIVDLFDTTAEILHRGLGIAGILRYEMLRAPGMIQQILPVSVLIGGLTTFAGLARNSEMAALRSTGITIYRMILMVLPALALLAVAHFFIADQVAPRSERALSVWWKATELAEDAKPKQGDVWFRTRGYLVYAQRGAPDGRRLEGLTIYRRNADGDLVERIVARAAELSPQGQWRLVGATTTVIGSSEIRTATRGDRAWDTELEPSDVVSVFSPDDRISSVRALRAITGERPADRSPAFYTTRVHRAFAEPLAVFVMLLLAAPAALGQHRNNQTSLLLFSLAAGLLFLMVDGVLTALGQTNVLPPVLGAWAGPALFAALGGAALVHLEG